MARLDDPSFFGKKRMESLGALPSIKFHFFNSGLSKILSIKL